MRITIKRNQTLKKRGNSPIIWVDVVINNFAAPVSLGKPFGNIKSISFKLPLIVTLAAAGNKKDEQKYDKTVSKMKFIHAAQNYRVKIINSQIID